ncbi:unnamed protein product [Protopolystoma xenopodis]|uniref:Uncharacterized protein n=1 Tax=Protopolystoma xenopodis TaxID=117903 RepID=A0A448XBN5_9PLAT|nr:unnamed protein product [Protopolystoma xenopodis]
MGRLRHVEKRMQALDDTTTYKLISWDSMETIKSRIRSCQQSCATNGELEKLKMNTLVQRDSSPLNAYGLPKIRQDGVLLGIIVNNGGSVIYQTSRFICNRLKQISETWKTKAQHGFIEAAGRCAEDLFAQIYNHSSKVTPAYGLKWSQLTSEMKVSTNIVFKVMKHKTAARPNVSDDERIREKGMSEARNELTKRGKNKVPKRSEDSSSTHRKRICDSVGRFQMHDPRRSSLPRRTANANSCLVSQCVLQASFWRLAIYKIGSNGKECLSR